jgi:hypothetical protein
MFKGTADRFERPGGKHLREDRCGHDQTAAPRAVSGAERS